MKSDIFFKVENFQFLVFSKMKVIIFRFSPALQTGVFISKPGNLTSLLRLIILVSHLQIRNSNFVYFSDFGETKPDIIKIKKILELSYVAINSILIVIVVVIFEMK